MSKQIKDYIKMLVAEHEMSVIPVQQNKGPAIKGWQKYCDELPTDEEIDSWYIFGNPTGVAIVTGLASNVGCIDVDYEDEYHIKRIHEILPKDAPIVQGNPKRGGKYLFKLVAKEGDKPRVSGKTKIGKHIDILCGNSYIIMPPSLYCELTNGGDHQYYKYKRKLENIHNDLPLHSELSVISDDWLMEIREIAGIKTANDMRYDGEPPTAKIQNENRGTGRNNTLTSEAGRVMQQRMPLEQAIQHLVNMDKELHGADYMFFNSPKMGSGNLSRSAHLNCLRWYADRLMSCAITNTNGDLEIPYGLDLIGDIPKVHDGWPKPNIPELATYGMDEFNTSMIPDKIRPLVVDVAKTNGVPVESCYMLYLTCLGSILGNKKYFQPKIKNKSWKEAHNIWTIEVAPSGSRKSQIASCMMKPIKDLQKRVDDDFKSRLKEAADLKEAIDPQIKEIERLIADEARNHLEQGHEGTNEYIKTLQLRKEKAQRLLEVVNPYQFIIDGATPEKALMIMRDNGGNALMDKSEIMELINVFKKKGYEDYRQKVMRAWDGNQTIRMQTKSSGDCIVEKSALSIYGAIQPDMFKKEMEKIKRGEDNDGLWQRTFVVYNEKGITDNNAIDLDFNFAKYFHAYEPMNKAYEVPETEDVIGIDHDAYNILMEYETGNNYMKEQETSGAMQSFISKNTGKISRLASIIEFISHDGNGWHENVSKDSMLKARYLMERQYLHIKKFFPEDLYGGLVEIVEDMKLGVIEDGYTMRRLRGHRGVGRDAERLAEIKEELVRRDIVRVQKMGSSTILKINPYLTD